MKSAVSCLILLFVGGSLATGPQTVFNFTDGSFTVLERLDLTLSIPYNTTDKETKTVEIPFQNVTLNSQLSSANESHVVLQLDFSKLNTDSLTQTFALGKNNVFSMVKMAVSITFDKRFPKHSKDDQTFIFDITEPVFDATSGSSYICDAGIHMTGSYNSAAIFTNVQAQPFGVKNKKFSKGEHCDADLPHSTDVPPMTTVMTTATPPHKPTYDASFMFKNGSQTCIFENITATFYFGYTAKNKKNVTSAFCVPASAKVVKTESHCGNSTLETPAVLKVTWDNNNFTQEFGVDDGNFYLKRVILVLNVSKLPMMHQTQLYKFDKVMPNNKTFRTPLKHSLTCDAEQNITFSIDKENMTLSFVNVTLQPFDIQKSNKLSDTYSCPADNAVSQIVPIIVGCALAVLVIIVLIAYLIGRRNSSKHGYESV